MQFDIATYYFNKQVKLPPLTARDLHPGDVLRHNQTLFFVVSTTYVTQRMRVPSIEITFLNKAGQTSVWHIPIWMNLIYYEKINV